MLIQCYLGPGEEAHGDPSQFLGPPSSPPSLPRLCNKGEALRPDAVVWPGSRGAVRLGARGGRGGPGYFWFEVRTAQRFPQPGGGVPSRE